MSYQRDLHFQTKYRNGLAEQTAIRKVGPAHRLRSRSEPAFCIAAPHDGNPASSGNGAMIAVKMAATGDVDTLHATCLELSGANEGDPGPRGEQRFHGGHFRDLGGNKLNAYVPGQVS